MKGGPWHSVQREPRWWGSGTGVGLGGVPGAWGGLRACSSGAFGRVLQAEAGRSEAHAEP